MTSETQKQAFDAPSRLHEFGRRRFQRLISQARQLPLEWTARAVEYHRAADADPVAGKMIGIFLGDGDRVFDKAADHFAPVGVEGLRVIKSVGIIQREKTGIKMIKPRRGELERHQAAAQGFAHAFMRADLGAETKPAEEHVAVREQVPFAFKKHALGGIADAVSFPTEKPDERRLLPP